MKNKIKNIAIICLLFICIVQIQAQNAITIATDPLAIGVLGGVEVEAGYNNNKNRFTVSYLSGELTPWYSQADDFEDTSHSVLEIGYSRFLNENQKGFSYGISYAYFTEFSVKNSLGQKLEKNPSKVSLKLAYAWYPFKTIPLYLEPSMTFGFFLDDEDLNFSSGEVFEKKSFIGNGPLFNVGYKFSF